MKNLLIFCLLLPLTSLAQLDPLGQTGDTWAVIIGISDYKDDEISDLSYAHVDALAFKEFLESPAGGMVPSDHIQILLNEEATNVRIADAINSLIQLAKEGDKVWIYLSGHGDVETQTAQNHGFFLAHDSPSRNYIVGAYPLFYLQSVISTLSQSKKAKVYMISDACRSGKLAGTEFGGPQASAKFLQQQFANEVKILACGPNQYSVEGAQWGDGHGAFSYHLLEGLQGLADTDEDYEITLYEIQRYLYDRVPPETAPTKQFPQTVGDPSASISLVDPDVLIELRTKKGKEKPRIAMVATKGMEEMIFAESDTVVQQIYDRFRSALAEERLLFPETDCAYYYYQQLKEKEEAKELVNLVQRNLAVSLQEKAQKAINAYLATDPQEMKRRWNKDPGFDHYPLYLEKSVELLGTKHFMAPNLNAKKFYFQAVNNRMEGEKTDDESLFQEALQNIERAIELEPMGAFLHNEKGLILFKLGKSAEEKAAYLKAHELAPAWVMPANNLAMINWELGQIEEAIEWGKKAIELKPDFSPARGNLGAIYMDADMLEEAETHLLKGFELDPTEPDVLLNLGSLYYRTDDYKKAKTYLEQLLELFPDHTEGNYNLANVLLVTRKLNQAISAYEKTLTLYPGHPNAHYGLGRAYEDKGELQTAIKEYELNLKNSPDYVFPMIRISSLYASLNQSDKAIEWLGKALEEGYSNEERIRKDAHLEKLLETESFKSLLAKHF